MTFPQSSLTFSDLYGSKVPGRPSGEVSERDSTAASGDFSTSMDLKRPAFYWVALVGLLVAIRVLWEKGK